MKRFKEFLIEKTFNLNRDVDYIYKTYIEKFKNKIINNKWDGKTYPEIQIQSTDLKSPIAKKASNVNEVTIFINNKTGSSAFYQPKSNSIVIGINSNALGYISGEILEDNNVTFEEVIKGLPRGQGEEFRNEFSADRIKGTIYHELSHWLDDTFHNRYIGKMLKKASEMSQTVGKKRTKEFMTKGKGDINLTFLEINAQIHAIKQLKRGNKDIWDLLTFDEMLNLNASLNLLKKRFLELGQKEYKGWKKNILKRLSREKLLGQNMR